MRPIFIKATFLGALALAGVLMYNNMMEAKSFGDTKRRYASHLLDMTLMKADTSSDGILQTKELSTLLKDLGCTSVLPDYKNAPIFHSDETRIAYSGPHIYLGVSDMERYIGVYQDIN